jgi:superfamily II DNA/RNA helicase
MICILLMMTVSCSVCVQASSIPSVLSGKDVVIAAETGSGKTYSYLLPLIDKLRGTEEYSLDVVSDKEVSPPARKVLLVLCPNVQLCEQVVRMANSLRGDNDETIVSAAAICGKQVVRCFVFLALIS